MKRIMIKLMVLVLVAGSFAYIRPANTASAEVKYYKIKGDWVGFDKATGTLTYAHEKLNYVPESIDGTAVKVIGKWAFNKNKKLKTAKIPSTVKEIEKGAFYRCEKLTKVSFAKKAKVKIAENAFGECPKLKTVVNNPSADWKKRIKSLNKVTKLLGSLDVQTVRDTKASFWLVEELTDDMWAVIRDKALELAKNCKTEREKAKAIYEYVAAIPYDYEWREDHSKYLEQSPYELIVWDDKAHGGKSVCTDCVGHTALTLVLLDSVDIPCVYVFRQKKGEETIAHGWNAARIDGTWIWIDTTQEFFDPGVAGFVCDTDHKRVDQINRIDVADFPNR